MLAAIADSDDRSAALNAIRDLLGVDELRARAVFDLEWQSLTRDRWQQVAADRAQTMDRLTEHAAQLPGPSQTN